MKLAALLFTVVALDALTFAAAASLGLVAYERNPMTRLIVGAVGIGGFVGLKLGAGGVGALLMVGSKRRFVRAVAVLVVTAVAIGAASNVVALRQLAG